MTVQESIGRKPKAKKGTPTQKWFEFERAKREYLALYPHCTRLEYSKAIAVIAQRMDFLEG